MPTLLDYLYVALFAVAFPLWDYLVSWPAIHRQLKADPTRGRKRLWISAMVYSWPMVAAGATIWMYNERSWTALGFTFPQGWRLWVAIALVVLVVLYMLQATAAVARDPATRATVRQQAEKVADLMPHSRSELYLFGGVSLTAGFCEEFLFRGYFIWTLAPSIGWWGAAALSILIFAVGHAYQGLNGVIQTAIAGTLYTLIVAITGSLWPAIAVHFLWDLAMGIMARLALSDDGPAIGDSVASDLPD